MNKLPRDIILIISKMHPLIIPPFTNKTLRRAVKDYLAGGDRKKRIVEKYGEISNWDTSKVTNMRFMFKGATSFNQPLNNWDVSNVTDMWALFMNASSFNQPLNNWNVSKVTNMAGMFGGATSFKGNGLYVFRGGCRNLIQPAARQLERVQCDGYERYV